MTVAKRWISFTPELLAEAEHDAKLDFDGNLSALVAAALDKYLRNRGLGRILDGYEAEHGAPTPEQMAEIDRKLWG